VTLAQSSLTSSEVAKRRVVIATILDLVSQLSLSLCSSPNARKFISIRAPYVESNQNQYRIMPAATPRALTAIQHAVLAGVTKIVDTIGDESFSR
jgi:hypothetical protein